MKIGIVTLSVSVNNYGGMLQAYALKYLLGTLGHEAEIIDKKQCPVVDLASRGLRDYLKIPYHIFLRIRKRIFSNNKTPIFHSEWYYLIYKSNIFLREKIRPRFIMDWGNIKSTDYDALIVGSDQVWRPAYFSHIFGNIRNAFLYFAKDWDVKKISYAPSFGSASTTEYTSSDLQYCTESIKTFDGVSVRDNSGLTILRDSFGINNATKVLDPVLLLSANHYSNLADIGTENLGNDLLCYILDENPLTIEVINYVASKTGFKAFNPIKELFNEIIPLSNRQQPSVEQWIRNFRDSKFVVTDSFHGCIMSILFHIPFICIINNGRGADRFYSLLSDFDLIDRIISKNSLDNIIDSPIDWGHVDKVLENSRQKSIKFIIDSLGQN